MAGSAAARANDGSSSKKGVLDDSWAIFDDLWCSWKDAATILWIDPSEIRDVWCVTRERAARVSEALVRKSCMTSWILLKSIR